METKVCTKCRNEKMVSEFNKTRGGENPYYEKVCRSCRIEERGLRRRGSLPEIPETDKAYIAGIIDGEGTIGIFSRGSRTGSFYLRVAVTNTNEALIDHLQNMFGGFHCSYKYSHRVESREDRNTDAWKVRYDWVLTTSKAAALLEMIMPYLIIKKQQAQLAIEFDNSMRIQGRKLPEEVQQNRIRLRDEMQALNKKGR